MIREATEQDLPSILEIYNDAVLNTTAVWHYDPFTLEDRQAWFEQRRAGGYPVIVFEQQGHPAGFATFGPFRPFAGYQYTVEHSVYVHPACRGQGMGEALLQALIQIAAEAKSYKTMVAGIDASNDTSIRLHRKLGFTCSGTIEKAGYKFGKWLDLVFYQLVLPGPEHPSER